MWIEIVWLYRLGVVNLDHPRTPHRGGERHLVETFALLKEVERSIHVRSGMRAKGEMR